MSERFSPPDGWVTVAAAAKALTDSGDEIDASNVSRYLARFEEIPQRKAGKFRFVDLAALVAHRSTNVLVGEKRAARDLPDEPRPPPPPIAPVVEDADEEDEGGVDGNAGSALNQANVRLKLLTIEDRQLDLDVKKGSLVPDVQVVVVLTGALEAFVAELERQETAIRATHGLDMAAAFRKSRKAAQAKAATKLLELARANLPEDLAAKFAGAPPAEG